MICENMKLVSFNEVAKMFNGEVDSQKFPVEGVILRLCCVEFSREIGYWRGRHSLCCNC